MAEITVDNYLQHLDKLTDEQITEFLNKDKIYEDDIQEMRELRETYTEEQKLRYFYFPRTDRMLAETLASL